MLIYFNSPLDTGICGVTVQQGLNLDNFASTEHGVGGSDAVCGHYPLHAPVLVSAYMYMLCCELMLQ